MTCGTKILRWDTRERNPVQKLAKQNKLRRFINSGGISRSFDREIHKQEVLTKLLEQT